jgi:phosphoribosylamine--glycine ligase
VILIQLKTDLTEVCEAILSQTLNKISLEWQTGSAACVVLAARHYPNKPQTGDIIYGLDLAKNHENVEIFHAGTAADGHGHFITSGGRVLGVTAGSENLSEALARVYEAVNDISWNGMQFRRDIGR